MRRKRLLWIGAGFLVLLVAIQLVPYGHDHNNPPVRAEPAWDSPRTRELAERTCFACHGNTTKWPWYGNIAPVSWYVQRDVEEGRSKLNFSEWDRTYEEAGEAAETVQEGEMPPRAYTWLHKDAKLTPEEKDALIRGLSATLGSGR
jgi:hypothetical protein